MSVGQVVSAIPSTLINATGDTNGNFIYGADYAGAYFLLTVSGLAATFSITDVKIQATTDGGTTWFNVQDWSALAINANGTYIFHMYPGAGSTGALKAAPASMALPTQFRVVLTASVTGGSATCIVIAYLQP